MSKTGSVQLGAASDTFAVDASATPFPTPGTTPPRYIAPFWRKHDATDKNVVVKIGNSVSSDGDTFTLQYQYEAMTDADKHVTVAWRLVLRRDASITLALDDCTWNEGRDAMVGWQSSQADAAEDAVVCAQPAGKCVYKDDAVSITPRVPVDTYTCACTPGYADGVCDYDASIYTGTECAKSLGGRCDVDVNECASDPCGSHGACIESETDETMDVNKFRCACQPHWRGELCDEPWYECTAGEAARCVEDATCQEIFDDHQKVRVARCVCQPGWKGDGHHSAVGDKTDATGCTDVDECESAPCENGATCRDSHSSPTAGTRLGCAVMYTHID